MVKKGKDGGLCSICGAGAVFVADVKRDNEIWALLCRKCYMKLIKAEKLKWGYK